MRRYSSIEKGVIEKKNITFYLTMHQTNRKVMDEIKKNSYFYVVTEGERIETIAKKLLGDEREWSAIAILNDLVNPWDIRAGKRLFIPPDVDALVSLIQFWQEQENNIHTYTTKYNLK